MLSTGAVPVRPPIPGYDRVRTCGQTVGADMEHPLDTRQIPQAREVRFQDIKIIPLAGPTSAGIAFK